MARTVANTGELDWKSNCIVIGVFTIYRLADPRTGATFYVGRTRDPYHRLQAHTWSKCLAIKNNPQLKARVIELSELGLKPAFAIIEQTPDKYRERYWIQHLLRLGVSLVNITGRK